MNSGNHSFGKPRKAIAVLTVFALVALAGLGAKKPVVSDSPTAPENQAMEAKKVPSLDRPWTSSIGMEFLPVSGCGALFSKWETRVQDFEAFVKATGHDATKGMYSARSDGWKQRGDTWKSPGFTQGPTHPVCGVSWDDAVAFCEWLTDQERSAGRLPAGWSYRLPTDAEWSMAVGLNESSGGTPKDKDEKTKDVYPWGTQWPPPKGAGNYHQSLGVDSYEVTAPVGSFAANQYGLCDMGGNVWEWCEDFYDGSSGPRVLRGGSWDDGVSRGLLSSFRFIYGAPEIRGDNYGFRCVLAASSRKAAADKAAEEKRAAPGNSGSASSPSEPSGVSKPVDLGGGVTLEMVWCPAGGFEMGSPAGEASRDNDETQHSVTLTKGFWLGKYEVTQEQWERVMGSNPSNFKGSRNPVEQVSWTDCQEFIKKLNEKVGRAVPGEPSGTFRLPTEAEWEYACRGGRTGAYVGDLGQMGWYDQNSGSKTHPVGEKLANGFGLYDMHGNVWEWCSDWYGEYASGSVSDPTGPSGGSRRVNRGGCWFDCAWYCRSANRVRFDPDYRGNGLGLRLARN